MNGESALFLEDLAPPHGFGLAGPAAEPVPAAGDECGIRHLLDSMTSRSRLVRCYYARSALEPASVRLVVEHPVHGLVGLDFMVGYCGVFFEWRTLPASAWEGHVRRGAVRFEPSVEIAGISFGDHPDPFVRVAIRGTCARRPLTIPPLPCWAEDAGDQPLQLRLHIDLL
ncbi:MAG: hypothetical protein AB7Q97_16295 [Gammaproteobacteria bacterium]